METPFHAIHFIAGNLLEEIPSVQVFFADPVSHVSVQAVGVTEIGNCLVDNLGAIKDATAQVSELPEQHGNQPAAAAANVDDESAGDLLPGIVCEDARSLCNGTAAQRPVHTIQRSLCRKPGEHIQVGVKVDLRRHSLLALAAGGWDPTRHVVELVAVKVNPVPPAGPVILEQQGRALVIGVDGSILLIGKNPCALQNPHDLLQPVLAGATCLGELGDGERALLLKDVGDVQLDRSIQALAVGRACRMAKYVLDNSWGREVRRGRRTNLESGRQG